MAWYCHNKLRRGVAEGLRANDPSERSERTIRANDPSERSKRTIRANDSSKRSERTIRDRECEAGRVKRCGENKKDRETREREREEREREREGERGRKRRRPPSLHNMTRCDALPPRTGSRRPRRRCSTARACATPRRSSSTSRSGRRRARSRAAPRTRHGSPVRDDMAHKDCASSPQRRNGPVRELVTDRLSEMTGAWWR